MFLSYRSRDSQVLGGIVALDFKPDPDKLARWAELGVTEVLFGLPDKSETDVAAYVERLAGKLAAIEAVTLQSAVTSAPGRTSQSGMPCHQAK